MIFVTKQCRKEITGEKAELSRKASAFCERYDFGITWTSRESEAFGRALALPKGEVSYGK